MRFLGCAALVSIVFALAHHPAAGQVSQLEIKGKFAEAIPLEPHQEIPDAPFTSWSLFLVCEPAWLLPTQEPVLLDLKARYVAFGRTTGRSHAAVWFEPFVPSLIRDDGKVLSWGNVPGSVDVVRNVEYCGRFNLVPSEGPHIVVTTIHPDRWQAGDPKIVLAFARRPAQDIQAQLSKLNDQIAAGRLSQIELNSVRWWNAWSQIIETACGWLKGVKWVVDVKVLKVEKSGVCT